MAASHLLEILINFISLFPFCCNFLKMEFSFSNLVSLRVLWAGRVSVRVVRFFWLFGWVFACHLSTSHILAMHRGHISLRMLNMGIFFTKITELVYTIKRLLSKSRNGTQCLSWNPLYRIGKRHLRFLHCWDLVLWKYRWLWLVFWMPTTHMG